MLEKRQSVRCAADETIQFTLGGSPPHAARVMDISADGLGLRVEEPLDPGVTVYLELDALVPDFPEEAAVEAVVQHASQREGSGGWQVGLKMKLSDSAQDRSLRSRLSACEADS